ncbi:hypothetical protein Tco_0973688 [Tanacetum coccineum]
MEKMGSSLWTVEMISGLVRWAYRSGSAPGGILADIAVSLIKDSRTLLPSTRQGILSWNRAVPEHEIDLPRTRLFRIRPIQFGTLHDPSFYLFEAQPTCLCFVFTSRLFADEECVNGHFLLPITHLIHPLYNAGLSRRRKKKQFELLIIRRVGLRTTIVHYLMDLSVLILYPRVSVFIKFCSYPNGTLLEQMDKGIVEEIVGFYRMKCKLDYGTGRGILHSLAGKICGHEKARGGLGLQQAILLFEFTRLRTVPVGERSEAKVTEWVSRKSLKRTM